MPLEEGDLDLFLTERWEKMRLRKVFDVVIREKDEMKRECIFNLNSVHVWSRKDSRFHSSPVEISKSY